MEKISIRKLFTYFVWTPLGRRVNIYINFFASKFTLRCLQPDIVPIICHWCQQHKRNWWKNLPLASLIPVANLLPVSLILAAILPPVSLTPWCTLTCEYLREFSKKLEMTLKLVSGPSLHEKKPEAKIIATLSV